MLRFVIPVIIMMIAGSCSTKKNTVVTRSYHNLTSHFNIYFNAYDSYYQGIKKAESSFKDDYNTQLPLFTYSSKEAARIILSDMDKTVKKCSKVVAMHSIKAKPKLKKGNRSANQKEFYRKNEYVKWVDDAFLLMGKAYFYKRDFFPAIETFEYIFSQFPDGGLTDEASLWLAMTQLELKRYPESQQILNRLQGDPKFNKNLQAQLKAVYADWYLRQGDLVMAIPLLEKAAEEYPQKAQRTRISYVLGQVYEKSADSANASKWYTRVNELNPPYEMAFNARINRARLYQGGDQAAEGIRKELIKMLKDAKNVDFLDQVYYALAELEMKQGNEAIGIDYYKKSIWNNVANVTQKAMSYMALAKHYYDKEEFVPAGQYYDSCSMSLPDTYPDYQKIIAFAEDVRMLSENLSLAQREDSLQRVAKMPADEREKLIAGMVAAAQKIEDDEKAAAEEERLNVQSGRMSGMGSMSGMNNRGTFGTQMRNPGSSQRGVGGQQIGAAQDMNSGQFGGSSPGGSAGMSGSSSWYFYNPAAMSFGSIEFIKFWGRRKLEDNWRRSNKKVISEAGDLTSEGETGELSTPAAAAKSNAFKPTQREFYLNDLPLNDTLMGESNQRIAQAYLNTGKIFKDELNRPNEAVQYFDWLNKRFPEDERLLFSYYNMYQIYTALKVEPEVKRYKDLILEKFPDSRSAKIISNPNYFQELDQERADALSFYSKTYLSYKAKSYKTVLADCARADTAFKVNPIRDKFGLLKIMAYAKVNPADSAGLVKSINDLIFKYPESEVADPAKNLLSYIQKGPSSAIDGKAPRKIQIGQVVPAGEQVPVEYFADDASTHFYIVVVSGATVDVGKLKFRISNFNVEKYDEDFFEVESTIFDEDLQIITVKNFTNKIKGMDYFQAITADPKVYEDMKDTDYRHFIISKDNYTRLYKNKNIFEYYQFFRDNYLTE